MQQLPHALSLRELTQVTSASKYTKATCWVAGFGSVCVAATSWWSFWAGTAIMATVYPFFILIACPSDPRHIQQQGTDKQPDSRWLDSEPARSCYHPVAASCLEEMVCLPSADLYPTVLQPYKVSMLAVLKARKVSGLQPLHIFAPAMVTTNWLVCHGPEIVAAFGALQRHPRRALACLLAILVAFCGFVVSR